MTNDLVKRLREDDGLAERIEAANQLERDKARIEALEAALKALVDLNDNHAPFGGEIYQDRINRTWDKARAALAGDA